MKNVSSVLELIVKQPKHMKTSWSANYVTKLEDDTFIVYGILQGCPCKVTKNYFNENFSVEINESLERKQ